MSPDGKRTILISADNRIAGVWIQSGGVSTADGMVALYHDKDQGPVVGVYGKDKAAKSVAAAFSVDQKGGILTITDGQGEVGTYNAASFSKLPPTPQ